MAPTDNTNQQNSADPTSDVDGGGSVPQSPADTNQPTQNNSQPELPSAPQSQLTPAGQALNLSEKASATTPAQSPPKAPAPPIVDPPNVADDEDLIEQEWVDKAKAIVDRTHNDPYLQNQELGKFKADYIKKRYNREIKVSEE
ncbi:MAG TPA: hypothetical protein VJC09_00505 [Candidatus Saccharimonadales bacterium]|nr:hypothetical protein [Candidatus Saccharimonadales bacterium]